MKIFFILLMVLGSSVAFCSQTVAIRVSQNKNSHVSFLLEVFHFQVFSNDLPQLESKLNNDTSLALNNSAGVFFLKMKKSPGVKRSTSFSRVIFRYKWRIRSVKSNCLAIWPIRTTTASISIWIIHFYIQ